MIVGEVWVALRPEMTSFGSDIRRELGRIVNPSGATGLAGLMNKVGALSLAGLVTAGVVAAKFASDQQVSQAKLQGTMDITAQKAADIGKAFLSTAGQSTFSGNEMMAAFAPVGGQLLALDGHALSAAQSLGFMNANALLAEATGGDLTTTTQSLTNVLQAFQLKTNDAAGAANTLYTVSTATGVAIPQLSQVLGQLHMKLGDLVPRLTDVGTLMVDLAHHGTVGSRGIRAVTSGIEHLIVEAGKAGPKVGDAVTKASDKVTSAAEALQKANLALQAKQASFSISGGASTPAREYELAAAHLRVTDAVTKLNQANRNLAAAQAGLNSPTSSATELLKKWGVELFNANGKFIGMRNLIITLRPHIMALHGETRQAAIATLFGSGAAQQFNKLLVAGVEGYDKAAAATKRHNAVVQAAAAYQRTLQGEMKIVKATLYDLATNFGTLLLPVLTDVAKIVGAVTTFFMHNKVAAELLGIAIGTVLGAAMLHYVGSVSVKFAKAIQGDLQGILNLGKGIQTSASRVTLASGEFKDALGHMHAANGKFIASTPELEAAFAKEEAAAGATGDAAVKSGDKMLVSFAKQIAGWAKSAAAAVAGAATTVGGWIAAGASATASAATQVASWVASAAAAAAGAAVQVAAWAAVAAGAVAAFIAENIATLGIVSLIALIVTAIVWMALHWKQTWDFVKSVALAVWHFLDNDVIHPIERAFHWLIGEIKAHWDLLLPIFLGPIGAVLLIWKHFHNAIIDGIKNIVGFFISLPGRILNAVAGFATLLFNAGVDLMKGLGHGIIHGLDGVRHTVAHVTDNVVGWVTSGFGIFSPSRKFAEIGGRLMEGLGKGISDGSHLARNALSSIGLKVPHFDTATFTAALNRATAAFRQFETETSKGTSEIASCFKNLTSTALSELGHLGSSFLSLGGHVVGGLAHGITDAAGTAVHAVGGVVNSVVGAVTSGFGIFSPSRKFRELGKHLPEGFAQGILDGTNLVKTAISGLTGVNVPGVHTGASSAAVTVEHQLLIAMRQLVTETRQNTAAVHELTVVERKPIKATITKSGSHGHGGSDRQLALLLAR